MQSIGPVFSCRLDRLVPHSPESDQMFLSGTKIVNNNRFFLFWFFGCWFVYFEFFVFAVKVDRLIVRLWRVPAVLQILRRRTADEYSSAAATSATAAAGQTQSVQGEGSRDAASFGPGVVFVASAHRHQIKLFQGVGTGMQ